MLPVLNHLLLHHMPQNDFQENFLYDFLRDWAETSKSAVFWTILWAFCEDGDNVCISPVTGVLPPSSQHLKDGGEWPCKSIASYLSTFRCSPSGSMVLDGSSSPTQSLAQLLSSSPPWSNHSSTEAWETEAVKAKAKKALSMSAVTKIPTPFSKWLTFSLFSRYGLKWEFTTIIWQ